MRALPHLWRQYGRASASAGGGGTPGIVGTLWTPARDGGGFVTPAARASVPLNTWLKIAGMVIDPVLEYPRYTTSTGTGGDATQNIVRGWSSMAHDKLLRKVYEQGGGHSDTSKLENGITEGDLDKLIFTRYRQHAPLSAWQVWDEPTSSFVTVNVNPYAHLGAGGGDGAAAPLLDNSPGAVHNYFQLVHIPASFAGNTRGWLYQGGWTRSVLDLDTNTYKVCHYWGTNIPPLGGVDWGGGVIGIFDGDSIYHFRGATHHHRFKLSGSETTTWSYLGQPSFGQLLGAGDHITPYVGSQYDTAFCRLPERREAVFFCNDGTPTVNGTPKAWRVRYGQVVDLGSSTANWSPYTDAITLTSSDGSLADWTSIAFHDKTVLPPGWNLPGESALSSCGTVYDAVADCIYMQGNEPGSKLYKITGISSGTTWNVETVPGASALSLATIFTYDRFCKQDYPDGTSFLYRLTSTLQPMECLRIR